MTTHDENSSKIREALDREVARRFDEERCAQALVRTSSEGAHHPEVARHDRREGPFGRLPVAVQWAGLAAALLGAALGIRALYLEKTSSETPVSVAGAANPTVPPGADAAIPVPGTASAPPLYEAPPAPPKEKKMREAAPDAGDESLVAESAPSLESLGVPDAEPLASKPETDPAADPTLIATSPGAAGTRGRRDTAERVSSVGGTFPGIVTGPRSTAAVATGPGVRVVSASIGGRPVRPEVREAPEAGATFVLLPALARLSALRSDRTESVTALATVENRAPRRRVERSDPTLLASLGASGDPPARLRGVTDEAITMDDSGGQPGHAVATGTGGAYYVRLFLGSRFDPMVESSQGLMGDGLQVVPLRENEIWGDVEQERFLSKTFRLSSLIAVDGAQIEPDEEDATAESSFVVGVAGHLFDVFAEGSPAETQGFHQLELRVRRAEPKQGESSDGAKILSATLIVENGRIVVVGIPEAEDAVHAGRGPRVVFVALSPRFGEFASPKDSEPVYLVEGEVEPPVLVDRIVPEYSPEARDRHAEGKVILQAAIRADGAVDGLQVLRVPQVPGGEYLVESAARAVRQWRYLPAQLHGEPVSVFVNIVVQFSLEPE